MRLISRLVKFSRQNGRIIRRLLGRLIHVEPVEKVKFSAVILSEARKRIGNEIVCPYDRECAKRGMMRGYGGHA